MVRKKVGQLMKGEHERGFVHQGEFLVPAMAAKLQVEMKGWTAERIAEENPSWVKQYKEKYKAAP